MMLLWKIWNFCEKYPGSLALIVRKEYTDLHDSTLKDFERYFGKKADAHKEYHFPNGSAIMFRHGSELNVLKNINLSIVGIEQAEEFETEETFTFLRDRLRREGAPYRQLCIIANTNGHNWIWRLWKNNNWNTGEYQLDEANTFENEDNLPKDFIEDLKKMAEDSPNHYRQFVMNDWEQTDSDDYLFTWVELREAVEMEYDHEYAANHRILGVDVARFGDDETVFTILERRGINQWEQIFKEKHQEKDLMWTTGRLIDIKREFNVNIVAVDDNGLGGGVTDRLRELGVYVVAFMAQAKPENEELYKNRGTECYFRLQSMIFNGYLKLQNDHNMLDQLLTLRYKYTSRGQKVMISKDDMRKEGIKSPDQAESLMIAASCVNMAMKKKVWQPPKRKVY